MARRRAAAWAHADGMTLSLGGRREVKGPSSARLALELKRLDPLGRAGFACLTGPDGSYLQAGGGRVWFLLERRDVGGHQLRAHLPGSRVPFADGTTLSFGAGPVALKADEWIPHAQVLAVFDAFLHGRPLPDEPRWRDVHRMLGLPRGAGVGSGER